MARPFVYLVGGGLPRNVEWKLARHADIVLRLPPPPPWPSSARHPIEPARSYSFQKLGVFNLTRFSSLLFFDPDVFWLTGSPAIYFDRYASVPKLAAVEYTGELVPPVFRSLGLHYFNAGLMLVRPNAAEYAALMARWRAGEWTSLHDPRNGYTEGKHGGDNDLLIAHFGGSSSGPLQRLISRFGAAGFTPMRDCDNFRGYVKVPARSGGQGACKPAQITAWHGLKFRRWAYCAPISHAELSELKYPEALLGGWSYLPALRSLRLGLQGQPSAATALPAVAAALPECLPSHRHLPACRRAAALAASASVAGPRTPTVATSASIPASALEGHRGAPPAATCPRGAPAIQHRSLCYSLQADVTAVWQRCSYGSEACQGGCGERGVCFYGQCYCQPGYDGPGCGQVGTPPPACDPNGPKRDYIDSADGCLRHPGYGSALVPETRWRAAQAAEAALWAAGAAQRRTQYANRHNRASGDRASMHLRQFNNFASLPAGHLGHLVEIGCGPWTQSHFLLRKRPDVSFASATLVDPGIGGYLRTGVASYVDGMLAGRVPVRTLAMGAEEVPRCFDGAFDALVLINVVEHAFNAFAVLDVAQRLLRAGGILVFQERVVRRDVGDQMYHPVRLSAAFFEQWLHTVCNHTLYRRVGREWPTVEMRTKRDFLRRNFIEDEIYYICVKRPNSL